MSEYVRITDRKIELTDEGVDALMADYIPTTERVRTSYACQRESIYGVEHDFAEFDRWLAEVKAQAWEEGYTQGSKDMYDGDFPTPNPYRQQTQ